uniref:G-protein coupled receptors family 1 profile domain-containing protein n=1 Tax=Vombatus ursinus TaxID=29139 RepID=A0A4X2JYD3_VOMUR
MAEGNKTSVTEFVLTGLTDLPEPQIPLFLVFLVIYLTTTIGNIGLVVLVWMDSHLQVPIYLFLSSLAFSDALTSSSVTAKIGTTECFLLAVMAYDQYAAICNPLLYPVRMSNRLCSQLVITSNVVGFLHSLIHVGLLLRLIFCKSTRIHYFYCEILQLFKISCPYPSINTLVVFIFSTFVQTFTFMIIIISYAYVFSAILRIKSEKGRSKAFSTCCAHLLSFSLFFGTLFFMYVSPGSGTTKDQDVMYSLFYTTIIPLLNPFIYILRNKEALGSLRKVVKK